MKRQQVTADAAGHIEPPNLRRYGTGEAEAHRYGYHPSPDPPSVVRRNRVWDEREGASDGSPWKKERRLVRAIARRRSALVAEPR
ncbi:hypothetical protein ACWGKL_32305, partial [Streptomyces nigrescens]